MLPVIGQTFLISVSQRILGGSMALFSYAYQMQPNEPTNQWWNALSVANKAPWYQRKQRGTSSWNMQSSPPDAIKKLLSKALEMPTKTKLTENFAEQKPTKTHAPIDNVDYISSVVEENSWVVGGSGDKGFTDMDGCSEMETPWQLLKVKPKKHQKRLLLVITDCKTKRIEK